MSAMAVSMMLRVAAAPVSGMPGPGARERRAEDAPEGFAGVVLGRRGEARRGIADVLVAARAVGVRHRAQIEMAMRRVGARAAGEELVDAHAVAAVGAREELLGAAGMRALVHRAHRQPVEEHAVALSIAEGLEDLAQLHRAPLEPRVEERGLAALGDAADTVGEVEEDDALGAARRIEGARGVADGEAQRRRRRGSQHAAQKAASGLLTPHHFLLRKAGER